MNTTLYNRFSTISPLSVVGRLAPPVAMLFLACLLVYLPELLHHGFVNWDDPLYITDNLMVHGLTTEHLRQAFTTFYACNYAPLHLVSYMVDFHLWGQWSPGYLLENVALHAANGLLLFLLLERITGSRWGAFLGSLLFLVHPVQVESVAWASQRKNLLAMFFFLAAFHAYLGFNNTGWSGGRGKYLLSLLLFGCALLTKSVTIIFPVALVLFDQLMGRETARRWKLLEKVPFIVMAIACAILTVAAQDPTLHQGQGGMYDIFNGERLSTFLTMTTVFFSYLRMLILPRELSVLYHPPFMSGVNAAVAVSLAGLFLLAVLFIISCKRWRGAAFWGGLFILGLLPVSQIVPLLTLMNDRYLYFPMIGAAGGIALLYEQAALKGGRVKAGLTAALIVSAVILASVSVKRVKVWKDSVSLWTDASLKSPALPAVWLSLGDAQRDGGDLKGGRVSLRKAMAMIPQSHEPVYHLARLEARAGNRGEALALLERAVQLGFTDRKAMEREADFDSLRREAGFLQLNRYFHLVRNIPGYRSPAETDGQAVMGHASPAPAIQ